MIENQPYNEKELLLRIAEGEGEAFTLLYQKYSGELRPYLWKFTNSKADAAEIIQETFIRVWLYRDRLPQVENVRGWIYKVASREALTYLRNKLNEQRKAMSLSNHGHLQSDPVMPDQTTQAGQIQQLVQKAIAEMPEQRRKIFHMRRTEGLQVGEIAKRLDLSVSTVKNTVIAAQKQIRQQLELAGYSFPLFIYLTLGFF